MCSRGDSATITKEVTAKTIFRATISKKHNVNTHDKGSLVEIIWANIHQRIVRHGQNFTLKKIHIERCSSPMNVLSTGVEGLRIFISEAKKIRTITKVEHNSPHVICSAISSIHQIGAYFFDGCVNQHYTMCQGKWPLGVTLPYLRLAGIVGQG